MKETKRIRTSKPKIISYLNQYWLSQNVNFGSIIHKLKPKNIYEWTKYLTDHNWFLIKNIREQNFKESDIDQWRWYLKHSFWKLFTSESQAIKFFKSNFNVGLKFTSRTMDYKYGVDFKISKNQFLIVKSSLYDQEIYNFCDYKQLKYFSYRQYNLTNSEIFVYVSSNNNIYKYCPNLNKLELVEHFNPTTNY